MINFIFICIENLSLNGNILHSTIPYQLGTLDNLVRLNLASNNLTGAISEIEFKNLQFLNFDNNTLNGTIPENIFNLDKIESFYPEINMMSEKVQAFRPTIFVCSVLFIKTNWIFTLFSPSASLVIIDL